MVPAAVAGRGPYGKYQVMRHVTFAVVLALGLAAVCCVAGCAAPLPATAAAFHFPTTLASRTDVGQRLLVRDRAPAQYQPSTYAYIMPEDQQRRLLAEAPRLTIGLTIEEVVARLGNPNEDHTSYPSIKSNMTYRALVYYFAKRDWTTTNLSDPCIEIFFNPSGRLDSLVSNVDDIPSINWPYGD